MNDQTNRLQMIGKSTKSINNEILISSDVMRVEYFQSLNTNNKKLVFLFTVFKNRSLEGMTAAGSLFLRNGYDIIAFKISNDDWYQAVPEILFEKINIIISGNGYVKNVAYGSSMGAYASIAFSSYLNCNIVIAMSPQFSIDDEFDTNWASSANKVGVFKYRISSNSINPLCKYHILYDNKNKDLLHADKISSLISHNKLNIIKIPYSGHPVTTYLSEVDALKYLVISIADETHYDHRIIYKNKIKSKTYLRNLSVHLLRKKHFSWALSTINLAIQLDGEVEDFHRQKRGILNAMGRVEDAKIFRLESNL